jgi:hypothetical protein
LTERFEGPEVQGRINGLLDALAEGWRTEAPPQGELDRETPADSE